MTTRIVRVSPEFITMLMTQSFTVPAPSYAGIKCITGLPPGAHLDGVWAVDCDEDGHINYVEFVYVHPEFEDDDTVLNVTYQLEYNDDDRDELTPGE